MEALLVLLSATAVMANPTKDNQKTPFPVTALIFTIIFSLLTLLNIFWIANVRKQAKNQSVSSVDIEKQSLVRSTLFDGDTATSIAVSENNCAGLQAELRPDENLIWAHEDSTPHRASILGFLTMSLVFAVIGLIVAFIFMMIFTGDENAAFFEKAFLGMWIPLLLIHLLFIVFAGLQRRVVYVVIYALTSKRLVIFSSVPPSCHGSNTETVRAYDLDAIHQTTLTRKKDGSGTLTFSTTAGLNEDNNEQNNIAFVFANIPNVSAVKGMIEQYKTLRQKHADNQ